MSVPDIAVLVLLGLSALVGAFRGLVRMVYRLASLVVSFLVFLFLAPPVARWIAPWPVFDVAREGIARFLLDRAGPGARTVSETVAALGLPDRMQALLLGQVQDPQAALSTAAGALADRILVFALTAAVGLVLFVVAMLLLWLATEAVEAGLRKAKFLDGVNHVAGAVLGLAETLAFLLAVLAMLALASAWLPDAVTWVEGTTVLGFLYRVNPLLLLLGA